MLLLIFKPFTCPCGVKEASLLLEQAGKQRLPQAHVQARHTNLQERGRGDLNAKGGRPLWWGLMPLWHDHGVQTNHPTPGPLHNTQQPPFLCLADPARGSGASAMLAQQLLAQGSQR